jgi:hypothetical protein
MARRKRDRPNGSLKLTIGAIRRGFATVLGEAEVLYVEPYRLYAPLAA